MNSLLLLITVCCFAAASVGIRLYQVRVPGQEKGIRLFQAVLNFCTSVLFYCSSGLGLRMSGSLWLMAGLFGIFAYVASAAYALSLQKGPMSLAAVLVNMSLVWPLLYSVVGNHERLTGLQIAGILLMLVTLALSALGPGGEQRRATLLWLVFSLTAFFCNGVTSTQQKMTVIEFGDDEAVQMMAVGYFISALLFLTEYAVKTARDPVPAAAGIRGFSVRDKLLTFGLSLGAGLTSYLGNLINARLCAVIPGAVLYPCVNGGVCLMASLSSFLFFREKMTKQKVLAMVCGITAIVLLNL